MNITRKHRLTEKIAGIRSMERALRAAKKQLTSNVDPSTVVAKGVTLGDRNNQLRRKLLDMQPFMNEGRSTGTLNLLRNIDKDLDQVKAMRRASKSRYGEGKGRFQIFHPAEKRAVNVLYKKPRYEGPSPFQAGPIQAMNMYPRSLERYEAIDPNVDFLDRQMFGMGGGRSERQLRLARARGERSQQRYLAGQVDKNFGRDVRKFNRASQSDQLAMLRQGAFEKFLGPNAMESLPIGYWGRTPVDKDALSSLLQPKGYTPGSIMTDYMSARLPGYKNISNADYIKNYKVKY